MTPLQLELTRLIGKKELTFGCLVQITKGKDKGYLRTFVGYNFLGNKGMFYDGLELQTYGKGSFEIIGHPATLSDLHRCMNENEIEWRHSKYWIHIIPSYNEEDDNVEWKISIRYDSYKDLLDQETSTLEKIISLIKENK